ncbi:hypothetical protein BCE02nite_61120 [Brevibacillus centrosporus]|jgi:hypothetical protein|uniref:Uncharacterized protein n=1 Tax=Brevibacillus centrosporus TaxID=54910 RepID=A0A1I3YEP1_9BACL|nr:hypothetical protein BCE02nite_61120 [Brevibacillus centrosporus]SFK30275.1 hypothetical protein SAMN05518846_11196 [Brevibacillus centrosporus]
MVYKTSEYNRPLYVRLLQWIVFGKVKSFWGTNKVFLNAKRALEVIQEARLSLIRFVVLKKLTFVVLSFYTLLLHLLTLELFFDDS